MAKERVRPNGRGQWSVSGDGRCKGPKFRINRLRVAGPATLRAAAALRELGWTFIEIGKAWRVSPMAASKWVRMWYGRLSPAEQARRERHVEREAAKLAEAQRIADAARKKAEKASRKVVDIARNIVDDRRDLKQ